MHNAVHVSIDDTYLVPVYENKFGPIYQEYTLQNSSFKVRMYRLQWPQCTTNRKYLLEEHASPTISFFIKNKTKEKKKSF